MTSSPSLGWFPIMEGKSQDKTATLVVEINTGVPD